MKADLRKSEEKYWLGETTLEEEEILRRAAADKDPALSAELIAAMGHFSDARDITLDDDFDKAFWQKADEHEKGGGKIFPLHIVLRYAAAAAVIAVIVFGTYTYFDAPQGADTQVAVTEADTFDNPEEAREAVLEALNFAAEKLNEGKAPAREIKRFHITKMTLIGKPATKEN